MRALLQAALALFGLGRAKTGDNPSGGSPSSAEGSKAGLSGAATDVLLRVPGMT